MVGTQTQVSHCLRDIYRRLMAGYGHQHWWPADGPFEVMVGAILTQSAAWGNVEKAIANNVLIIPGNVFSEKDTHFRISYATSDDKLRQGVEILRGLA